jgi:uncharacterized protein (TIGR02594 family)
MPLTSAVNAHGCNEAIAVSFSSRNPRGITFERLAQRHIASCCRHTAIFLTRPDAGHLKSRWGIKSKKDQLRMLHSFTFRRSLVALALCSTAFAFSVTPAAARSHHGSKRQAHARDIGHHARRHYALHRFRRIVRVSRWDERVAALRSSRVANAYASVSPDTFSGTAAMSGGLGSSDVVSEARRYLGGNPTGRGSLWCARFMNLVLERSGHRGTGSDMASSFASYGQRVSGPQIGAIAVMGRRGGGHVGIITGIDASGNPIMISGNNGNRVREAPISRGRIYAYVMPN